MSKSLATLGLSVLFVLVAFSFQPVIAGIGAQHGLTIFPASDGRLVVLTVDSNRFVQLSVQVVNGEERFSAWQNLGNVATSSASGGSLSDGGLIIFVRGAENDLAYKHAMTDKSWSVWKPMPTDVKVLMEPAVVKGADGKLEVYALGVDEHLYRCVEIASGDATAFSKWELVSHHAVLGLPTFAINSHNERLMYIRGGDNFLYESKWTPPRGWSRLESNLGLRILGDPVAVANADGRLEVFCRGADNAIYHKWQKAVKSVDDWSSWASIKGVTTANPAVALTWDKRLQVFARGSDNAIWSAGFDWDEGWGYWSSLGGKFIGSPRVASFEDGRVILFAVARDATIWYRSQTPVPQAEWNSWKSIGGDVFA